MKHNYVFICRKEDDERPNFLLIKTLYTRKVIHWKNKTEYVRTMKHEISLEKYTPLTLLHTFSIQLSLNIFNILIILDKYNLK